MAASPIRLVMAESIEATDTKGVDSASKLAADVNAAAEALDNLKHMLRRQFPDPVLARLQGAPEPHLEVAPPPENRPRQSSPIMSARALPQVPVASLLPAGSVHAAEPRRRGILGFLAGFASSAAIGALLYIYMMAG